MALDDETLALVLELLDSVASLIGTDWVALAYEADDDEGQRGIGMTFASTDAAALTHDQISVALEMYLRNTNRLRASGAPYQVGEPRLN